MTLRFLAAEAILSIQADSIEAYGGSHGLREPCLLHCALDRAENRYFTTPARPWPVSPRLSGWA